MKKIVFVFLICILTFNGSAVAFAHPGRTDAAGGHWMYDARGNRIPGSYHFHNDGGSAGGSGSTGFGDFTPQPDYYTYVSVYGVWLPLPCRPVHLIGNIRVYPVINVLHAMGYDEFTWDVNNQELSAVSPDGTVVAISLDSRDIIIGGETKTLRDAPFLLNDWIYAASELFLECADAIITFSWQMFENHTYNYVSIIKRDVYGARGNYRVEEIRRGVYNEYFCVKIINNQGD